jgi:hypothetical protein
LRELADLACDPERLADQEVVLVGWTDKETPGMTIQPQPSQAAVRTLVVAHLRFGAWPEPRCDHNTFQEMARGEEPE